MNKNLARAAIRGLQVNRQAATLKVRADAGGFTSYSIFAGFNRPSTAIETSDPTGQDVVACRWAVQRHDLDHVSAPLPRVGDVIVGASGTDGAGSWTVQSIDQRLYNQGIDCHCTRPR